jgi:hypothetical protein
MTQHRYMTANKQRVNPVACRTCGLVDRERECFICSACHLNVCAGCVGVLRRWKGELGGVVKEVEGRRFAGAGAERGRGRGREREVGLGVGMGGFEG